MDLKNLKIDLKGLKEDTTLLEIDLDNTYFKAINAPEVSEGNVHISLKIIRTQTGNFTLIFNIKGLVNIPCDLCLETLEQTIDTKECLEVKFGQEYSEEDNHITIDENEGILNIEWFIYEFIALNIPIKHVHAPGKCNPAMIRAIKQHSADRSGENKEQPIDPRWAALLKLKE